MKIAITGGGGDMGRPLIPYLVEQGHSVVCIDRTVPGTRVPGVSYLVADVCNVGEFIACLVGCDALVHLAAFRSPMNHPDPTVYANNTISSYNALYACAVLGINKICLASSINAIGGVYSRAPRYDYFPVDEQHPTYAEDPYSLSKWVLEEQANAFARRYESMTISSLRFHWLVDSRETVLKAAPTATTPVIKHLFAYTLLSDAARAILMTLTAGFKGHEVFYIVAPRTMLPESSQELARKHFPNVPVRGDLSGNRAFYSSAKAERMLGWKHTP
jgi:nucleoside-diphosphate-sugar epimerase